MDYNLTAKKESMEDGYMMPSASTSKEDLVKIAVDWEKESGEYHEQLKNIQDTNESYYKGKQTEMEKIPRNQSNAVQNHIFMGVETIIPIVTANSPRFIAEPPEESDTSIKYANAVEKTLSIIYEEEDVRSKGEMLMRHMMVFRYGVWIPFFNKQLNKCDVRWVRPQRIFFPKTSKLIYYYEKRDFTTGELKTEFGEEKFNEFLKNKYPEKSDDQRAQVKGIYTVLEFHTADVTFWKCGLHIIDVRENETYDFHNDEKNFFLEPKIPIIIASVFRLGAEPIGETDLIQQTISIQDTINVTNRLIINNATKTGNSQWFIDPEVMTEEEARTKITNQPGLIVWAPGAANTNKMRRDAPPALPNYIPELKLMAERAFDNILGTHSTTRGERGESETLGGRMLLKQSDYGRIDLLVREYERCVAELGNWFVQLMKINLTQEKVYRSYGESGSEFVKISNSMIERGLKVIIKSGTTLPTDEVSKRQEAIELWSLAALDPETLFERLKFPNPQEAAKKLQAWKAGQLQMEQQAQGTAAQPRERGAKTNPTPRGEIGKQQQKITKGY